MQSDEKIFITGASSGIGAAMAIEYAKRGAILGLVARRKDKLSDIAKQCSDQGANSVETYSLDVTDEKLSAEIAKEFMTMADGIDVVVANAGLALPDHMSAGNSAQINQVLNTNIMGVTNTIIPFIPRLKEQKRGKLVIVSSIASFMPMSFFGGYSASKVAVRRLSDSWRETLKKHNIQVTTICPGYVKSEMTDVNDFHMPFLMDADVAARKIIRAIDFGKKTYIFPWQLRYLITAMKPFPDKLLLKLLS